VVELGPLFTVIIPVRNKERSLLDSIDSVLSQSFRDFEVIVVDDASTDGTSRVLERVDDTRVRTLSRTVPGAGGYAARNLGIRNATGEWITFLDADDVWSKSHLEKKSELIASFPEENLISCDWLTVYGECKSVRFLGGRFFDGADVRRLGVEGYLEACLLGQRPAHTNVFAIRRASLADSDIFPEGRTERAGDIYCWLRMVLSNGSLLVGNFIGARRELIADNRVSKISEPDPYFFLRIQNELLGLVECPVTAGKLRRYLAHLLAYSVKESRRRKVGVVFVLRYMSPGNGLTVYLSAMVSQMMPNSLFTMLQAIKARLRGRA